MPTVPVDTRNAVTATSVQFSAQATPKVALDQVNETRTPRTVDDLLRLRARQVGCDLPIVAYL